MAKPVTAAKSGRAGKLAASRPVGRSLADFSNLSPAEKSLIEACRRGEMAVIQTEPPNGETEANTVRAAFVRFLALGGDDLAPVHEHGVRMQCAWITGDLDLELATVAHPLVLGGCQIDWINVRYANLRLLSLSGCRLTRGLVGDGLRCEGAVMLRDGFHATGEVRFFGAKMGSGLHCRGGRFENNNGRALICDGVDVSGDVVMGDGFHASGEVRLIGAVIMGDLNCSKGRFENVGHALVLDRASISGDVFLSDDFQATGTVRMIGAKIGGDLNCSRGSFDYADGQALLCDNSQVEGAWYFRSVTCLRGSVHLSSMRVKSLCDDTLSWMGAKDDLILDGFTYDRLMGVAPTNSKTRIAWLKMQRPDHLGKEFKPQPWEQLITVLRVMGHPNEARDVATAKQIEMRRSGRLPRGAGPFHFLYGLLVGYGYRPFRLLIAIVSAWLLPAAAYWAAVNPDWFGSSTHLIVPTSQASPANNSRPTYSHFEALVYSADVLLPVIDFGYSSEWRPTVSDQTGKSLPWGRLLRYLHWLQIVFGWLAGLLLITVVRNLIKKD